jgi:hypothetical protein
MSRSSFGAGHNEVVTAGQLEMISTDLTELLALSVKAGQPQLAGSS